MAFGFPMIPRLIIEHPQNSYGRALGNAAGGCHRASSVQQEIRKLPAWDFSYSA